MTPAGSSARAGGAARRNIDLSGARAQYSGFPRRYTVIRYRIDDRRSIYVTTVGRTRKSDGDHDYVGLAQARPNNYCMN